jgi:hypothetical protein
MTLTPGTRLGNCEIVAAVDARGRGDVRRRPSPRLSRDVAIKVPGRSGTGRAEADIWLVERR